MRCVPRVPRGRAGCVCWESDGKHRKAFYFSQSLAVLHINLVSVSFSLIAIPWVGIGSRFMPAMQFRTMLLLRLMSLGGSSAPASVRVCVVQEQALAMLKPGVSISNVQSDDDLRGFDVELRKHIFRGINYTISYIGSYGDINTRIRSDEWCDVGWGGFFLTATREKCNPHPSSNKCRPLDADAQAALAGTSTIASWEPYRCCVNYSPSLVRGHFNVSLGSSNTGFFAFTFQLLIEPFVLNFYAMF